MAELFGTDGIRGIAGEYPITEEVGRKLGISIVRFCKNRGLNPLIIIGRDTRSSGKVLETSILSGVISAGGIPGLAGVIPTPGVAYLTRKTKAGAGIVLSASHNPHQYNGFKVFSNEGFKLSEEEESEIERVIINEKDIISDKNPMNNFQPIENALEMYTDFLFSSLPEPLKDINVILDCANGATFQIAPALFERLAIRTESMFIEPDGRNINEDCGSQHTAALSEKVIEKQADAGLAFDGDGDRLIAVDEKGRSLTGDQLLIICATMMHEKGEMEKEIVVSTVMSNMGFRSALKKSGIKHIATGVGDRHVMEEMKRQGSLLGGEDSGHIIFLNRHTTGDGVLTALQLLRAIKYFNKPLSELSSLMTIYPQVLVNVPVKTKPEIAGIQEVVKKIEETEAELGDDGRVLVRYSGTEPLCRVMVEGKVKAKIEDYAEQIANVVSDILNS